MAALEEGKAAVSFVGRDRELARAIGLLDEARGAAVAWARSSDRDIAPPYGLWRLALRDLPGLPDLRDRQDKPEPDLWSLAFGGTAGRAVGGSWPTVRRAAARSAGAGAQRQSPFGRKDFIDDRTGPGATARYPVCALRRRPGCG